MNRKNLFTALILTFLSFPLLLFSTTVRPYENLGELIKASDAVVVATANETFLHEDGILGHFRINLTVEHTIKGYLKTGRHFTIQAMRAKNADLERTVWGDIDLKDGETYLLFLYDRGDGVFLPMAMTYYVYKEYRKDGQDFLVPVMESMEINEVSLASGEKAPPLVAYPKAAFINYAQKFVASPTLIKWNDEKLHSSHAPTYFYGEEIQAMPPSHCTYIFADPPGRWKNFPTPLPVHYEAGGQPGCASSIARVQGAITLMNAVYTGIELTDGGTHSFSPSCSPTSGGANGNEFTAWVNSNLGGNRHLVIHFDDPCNEIAPLSGCSGTLAIGGMYIFSSTHTFNGMTWRDAAWGYVVTNQGLGSCICANSGFDNMIVHEMTHALGIGHIAGSCTANMNPSLCTPPTALDIACLDFTYLDQPLPVELSSFSGRQMEERVQLNWATVSETNNDYFTLERSKDGRSYEAIATVAGYGFSQQPLEYLHIDERPLPGTNYYRLSQTDFDGYHEILGQIAVDFKGDANIVIMPNPLKGGLLNVEYDTEASGELEMAIYDLQGKAWFRKEADVLKGYNNIQLDLATLPLGVYAIRFQQNDQITTLRFIKTGS